MPYNKKGIGPKNNKRSPLDETAFGKGAKKAKEYMNTDGKRKKVLNHQKKKKFYLDPARQKQLEGIEG